MSCRILCRAVSSAPLPDQAYYVITGAASVVAIVSAAFAAHYGRRASASIGASIVETQRGVLLTANPRLKAVGIFRLWQCDSEVWVQEVSFNDKGFLVPGEKQVRANVFDEQFVEAGEEVEAAVLFVNPPQNRATAGWFVSIVAGAPVPWYRIRRRMSGWWSAQTFVPTPERYSTELH